MSREEHSGAGCMGKQPFANPQDAHRAIRAQQTRKPRQKGSATPRKAWRLDVYRCAHCGRWHIGEPSLICVKDVAK